MYFATISTARVLVLDTDQPPNPTLHQVNAQAEVHLLRNACVSHYSLTNSLSRQVTIQSVSDEVLLNIFRHFLHVSPRDWPRLVHTCRKWRHIALASQGALRLWLFCTHGTPVQKNLDCWPTLPIVVQYGGLPMLGPPTPEDEDDIMAALKQSGRVISISLTISLPLLRKLSTIEGVFSELQDLVLLSRDGVPLTMPTAFRWGPRLRRLHSTGITFPALLQPLYSSSSTNLMDLQLHDVVLPWQLSPRMLMEVLSKLDQLRSLLLHFRYTSYSHCSLPPDTETIFIPVLTRLNYRGGMAYLEGIVASIDAPLLKDIEITFFDNPTIVHSRISEFIDWIEIYRSHCGAHALSSRPTISISLTQPGSPTRLKLQVLRKPSRVQISSMAQICLDVSPLLFNDEGDQRIHTTRPLGRVDSPASRELLELLNQFTGKTLSHLDINYSITSCRLCNL